MSYTDYFTLENLATDVQTGKISFGKSIELAEMCLGVKIPKIPGLNEPLSKSSEEYKRAIEESTLPYQEYSRRVDAIIDFETKFGSYAEKFAPSRILTV